MSISTIADIQKGKKKVELLEYKGKLAPYIILKEAEQKIHFSLDFVDKSRNIHYTWQDLGIKKFIREGFVLSGAGILYPFPVKYFLQLGPDLEKGKGTITVDIDKKIPFLKNYVYPLSKMFHIQTSIPEFKNTFLKPDFKKVYLELKETADFVMIYINYVYEYKGVVKEFSKGDDAAKTAFDDRLVTYLRDKDWENEIVAEIAQLHKRFQEQINKEYFYLNSSEIIHKGWIFKLSDKAAELGIELRGYKDLKNLKFNPYRPEIHFKSSSGEDWFEFSGTISFQEVEVSLTDVRKAVMKGVNYVILKDDSIGILPDDWLKRYAPVFMFGDVKNNKIKITKKHFSVIDMLADDIDDEDFLAELEEKRNKLKNFEGFTDVEIPNNIQAQLRDYQKEGYKWLRFLNEYTWGGCLADDMGLGKTLQVITLLRHVINERPNSISLVVVPTSLIFNWQAELEKFCPGLPYKIHHGLNRASTIDEFTGVNIIITSYGTMRSDVQLFDKIFFEYIILDESQAIKNPASQAAKSVKTLKANNRLAMTGTPIENNTFDLYSQFDFVNPGLLGSQEFFRERFSNPIDKYRDAMKADILKKLIAPFILKRSKENVLKDLPDKTEMVLYCEMTEEQRKAYEYIKALYKTKVSLSIESNGLNQSGMTILEGLMKLRQICDSPALVKDFNFPNTSVKLDELTREISENAGHHKILVFSQFIGMLNLIKEKLDELNIGYVYLDGQSKDRGALVNDFKNDDEARVFLISLKAGGVGLNLTEADYVYLVDPWWNPAIEKQAIDRAHRFGQKNKVFAYRMICKDSVEEKILKLQEQKKLLSDDIISTETGFMKKLNKEDVLALFD